MTGEPETRPEGVDQTGSGPPASFRARLVPGGKVPYDSWVFVVIPAEVHTRWGRAGPWPVRGTLGGVSFRRSVARGEGVYRMSVPLPLREQAGVGLGDEVEVLIELDPEPRPLDLPPELRALFDADPELAARFAALAPSMRRAWAVHIASAKRPATRERRAAAAVLGIPAATWP
jgi:hypothetical protein